MVDLTHHSSFLGQGTSSLLKELLVAGSKVASQTLDGILVVLGPTGLSWTQWRSSDFVYLRKTSFSQEMTQLQFRPSKANSRDRFRDELWLVDGVLIGFIDTLGSSVLKALFVAATPS
jgi:hypothetical protein